MKKKTGQVITVAIALLLTFGLTYTLWGGHIKFKGFDHTETGTVKKDLAFTGKTGDRSLEIDNIFGAITVKGYDGDTVKFTAVKTIRAISKEKLAAAKKEVKLDITEKDGHLLLYVDGPFRCKSKDKGKGKCHGCCNIRDRGYVVQYDFTVKVPRRTALIAKTVTNGQVVVSDIKGPCKLRNVNEKISVENLTGPFDVKTVNGKITMNRIKGSGFAHTVNGKVQVDFVANPKSECSFKTINGKLDINFLPGLSADFKVKTFNGKVYSDFPPKYMPRTPAKGKRTNGKYVYKSNRFQHIRVGAGGPSISMDTLNGSIIIARK